MLTTLLCIRLSSEQQHHSQYGLDRKDQALDRRQRTRHTNFSRSFIESVPANRGVNRYIDEKYDEDDDDKIR
jgi:hypothetical protein